MMKFIAVICLLGYWPAVWAQSSDAQANAQAAAATLPAASTVSAQSNYFTRKKIAKAWLQTKISPDAAEKKHMVSVEALGPEPIAFGYNNGAWKALKQFLRPGDELWEFSSPEESWARLAGLEGLSIVRDKEIVASIITQKN